jgi:anaerobic dimethyl sulfoxide reductase subunit C (anchor subunit)
VLGVKMQWNDWAILLSEVVEQFSIGAFIIIGGVMLSGKLCFGQHDRVMKVLPLISWLLIASLLIREATLMAIQSSSNEGNSSATFFVLVFVALTLVYSLCENRLIGKDGTRKIIVGIMLLWSIAYVINILSFSANSGHVSNMITIIFSVGFGGSLLAHAMLIKAQHKIDPLNVALPLFGALIGAIVFVVAWLDLATLVEQTHHGLLLPFIWRIVSVGCLLAATGLWLMSLLTKTKPVLAMLACACVFAIMASLAVHGSF